MAKNFNAGVIVYDAQVEKFDMTLLPSENIEFPQGVMKKLDYFGPEVVHSLENFQPTAELAPGVEEKMARMGHIKAVADFAGSEFEAAEQARIGLAQQQADDKTELKGDIDAEKQRAEGAEAGLQSQITSNDSDIAANAAAILAEKGRAEGVEAGLQSSIDTNAAAILTEKGRAEGVEAGLQSSIDAMDVAYKAADGGLQDQIDAEKGRIDAMLSGSSVDFDTLKEIVDAYQLADTDIVDSITSLSGALNVEKSDRIAGDAAVQANLDAYKTSNDNALTAEQTARVAADNDVRSEFAAADVVLKGELELYADNAVGVEKTRAEGEEERIEGRVDAVSGAVATLEIDFQNALDFEVGELKEADSVLSGALDAYKLSNDTALTAEQTARITADQGLQDQIDAHKSEVTVSLATEKTEREAGDLNLQNQIDSNDAELAVINGDALTVGSIAHAKEEAKGYTDGEVSALSGAFSTSLTAEQTARIAADTALQNALDAEIAATNSDIQAALNDRAAIRTEFASGDVATLASAKSYTDTEIAALVDSAPELLDTLNELAAALGDDPNFATTVASDIADAKTELQASVSAVSGALSAHEAANITEFANVRSEFAAADTALQTALTAEQTARQEADDQMKTDYEAADAALSSSLDDEIAARAAGDLAEQTARIAAVSAEEAARISGDTALQTALDNEVARATAKEVELKEMQDRIYGGERHIVFNDHTAGAIYDSGGADFVPGKTTHILMSNSVVGAIATFPTLEPNKMVTVSLISTSPEPVEFKAPEGVSLDGMSGGDWVMYPGSSITLVEFGGTYYMV